MSEKEKFTLSDKEVVPTDDHIFSIIRENKILWISIMKYVSDYYKDMSGDWRYYNDYKQWLFKMTQKKKTIFWSGILEDTFRITFYFGDKAEPLITASDLPVSIKNNFKAGKKYGKIRAITFKMKNKSDVETVKKLISIKTKLK
jgi:hypothetical protein